MRDRRGFASLGESERFLSAALDALSAHIAILDSAGTVIATNEPWRRFGLANGFGDADPGLGMSYLAVCDTAAMSGASEAAAAAAGIRAVATGSRDEFSLEYSCHIPGSPERWFEMRARRLVSDRGACVGACVLVAHECITARRKAEREVAWGWDLAPGITGSRHAEVELRAVFEAMHDVVLVLSREGRYVKVAPTGAPLLYRPAEDLVGRTVHEVLPRQMADFTVETIGRSLTTGQRVEVEYELEIGGELLCFAAALTSMTEDTVVWVARDVTAARRADAELRATKARLEHMLAASPAIIYALRVEGGKMTPTWVSSNISRVMGHDPADANDVDWWRTNLHPDDRERMLGEHTALLTQGQAVGEYRFRHGDGRYRWVHDESRVVCGEDGGRQIIGAWVDATERKRAEEALRESEWRHRVLFERNPVPMWLFDADTLAILAVNDAAVEHYGYSREEFLGLTIMDLRPHEAIPELLASRAPAGSGRSRPAARLHRKKDGTLIWVEVISDDVPLDGRQARLVLAHDVTERRRAEVALREAHATLATLFAASPLAIVTLDTDARVTSWNPAAESMFGWRAHEVLGQPYPLVPAERRDEFDSQMRGFVEQGEGVRGVETECRRKDGGTTTVYLLTTVIRDAADRPQSSVAFITDVTERKQLEEQFRQAQKMEAVGLLAGGVAHDFNNLLTVIQTTSELLLEDVPAEGEVREDIRQIHKAAERAATLTRQLLAFSRRQMLQPVALDLNDVVHDIESMLGRLIGKHITLSAALGGELGTVQADRGQLEQVIMNLAVNARDAMPQGGTLTIETANVTLDETYAARRSVARPGRYVMLALSDTGTGMDAETKGRIFEPFFTTKSRTEGTGLGLATVYGIVKQSGGYIWVYSEPGRGTTFKIYLPRVDAPAASRSEPAANGIRVGGSETILLVEDEDQVRALARRALERQGYQVLEAPHGREAIAICGRHPTQIDLVLTDIVMPQLGGRALADWLEVERPAIKVVFMSGYTDGDLGRQGVLDSAVTYVQKPFTAAGLAGVVRGVLDGPTAAGPRTPATDAMPRLVRSARPDSASDL